MSSELNDLSLSVDYTVENENKHCSGCLSPIGVKGTKCLKVVDNGLGIKTVLYVHDEFCLIDLKDSIIKQREIDLRVFNAIPENGPIDFEEILEKTGLSRRSVSTHLLYLCLDSRINEMSGKRYERIKK